MHRCTHLRVVERNLKSWLKILARTQSWVANRSCLFFRWHERETNLRRVTKKTTQASYETATERSAVCLLCKCQCNSLQLSLRAQAAGAPTTIPLRRMFDEPELESVGEAEVCFEVRKPPVIPLCSPLASLSFLLGWKDIWSALKQ